MAEVGSGTCLAYAKDLLEVQEGALEPPWTDGETEKEVPSQTEKHALEN